MDTDIHIAAALILNPEGRTLLVRKRGAGAFMQAGGKIDPGETPEQALARELFEELGLVICGSGNCGTGGDGPLPVRIGRFTAPAANEPGHRVVAEIFRLQLPDAALSPRAEIEELLWIDPTDPPPVEIAPLTRDHLLPLLARA